MKNNINKHDQELAPSHLAFQDLVVTAVFSILEQVRHRISIFPSELDFFYHLDFEYGQVLSLQ
jgi:hypothetical protein